MRQSLSVLVAMFPAMMLTVGCRKVVQPPPEALVVVRLDKLPATPADTKWNSLPQFSAELLLQDLVEPRTTEPTTTGLRVRGATDGKRIALLLQWDDPAADIDNLVDAFPDACAVQFPARIEASLPAPQMGEKGKPVQITYWNAAWQALGRREPKLQAAYPNATVDHYPFNAPSLAAHNEQQAAMKLRYSPARAAANPVSPPHSKAVQDLVAEGPGTLAAAVTTASEGEGIYGNGHWSVVLIRPLPEGFLEYPRPQVAFAVWEGSHEEVGARKMRTGWIPIVLKGDTQ